jgi:hypothetical protein
MLVAAALVCSAQDNIGPSWIASPPATTLAAQRACAPVLNAIPRLKIAARDLEMRRCAHERGVEWR